MLVGIPLTVIIPVWFPQFVLFLLMVGASFVFFTSLGYGAAALSGMMQRPHAWRLLDAAVALVMFALAYGMARAGGWL